MLIDEVFDEMTTLRQSSKDLSLNFVLMPSAGTAIGWSQLSADSCRSTDFTRDGCRLGDHRSIATNCAASALVRSAVDVSYERRIKNRT